MTIRQLALMGCVYKDGDLLFSIDDEGIEFLKRCNGTMTVEEIVDEIFDKYSSRYKETGFYGALASTINRCEILDRKGVLLRVKNGE